MGRSLLTPRIRTQPVKKALSIAIRYDRLAEYAPDWLLAHAHDDSVHVINLLTTTFGYSQENIVVLQDGDVPQNRLPTRDNILQAMRDLVADGMPGDHLVCHISGHGSQVPCPIVGQEEDGMDEVFWPMDVEFHPEGVKNFIRDDDIKKILVDGLRPGASLVMIADCCNSGTMADLPHGHSDHLPRTRGLRIQPDARGFDYGLFEEANSAVTEPDEAETIKRLFPSVVCWSACKDGQVTYSPGNSAGLFVQFLTRAIEEDPTKTHQQLLHQVTELLARVLCRYNEALIARGKTSDVVRCLPRPLMSSLSYLTEIYATPVSESFGRHMTIVDSESLADFTNLVVSPTSSTGLGDSDSLAVL